MSSFYYESSNGDVILFDKGTSPFYADADQLRNYDVSYETLRNSVTNLSHEPLTADLSILISADTQREGAALLDRLQQGFDADIRTRTPGRMWVDGSYTPVYIYSAGFDCDESLGLYEIAVSTSVLMPMGEWITEAAYNFSQDPMYDTRDGFDYPYDFNFNYGRPIQMAKIRNELAWPCAAKITIYGNASEARNPAVFIGKNMYQVNVDIPLGGKLVIDGLDKSKIIMTDRQGTETNVFNKRASGEVGSGSYIFEPVPPGDNTVLWDGSFDVDVTLYQIRSWPTCTI